MFDWSICDPYHNYAAVFSVPSITLNDSISANWILQHIESDFKENRGEEVQYISFGSNQMSSEHKQTKLDTLKKNMMFDMCYQEPTGEEQTVTESLNNWMTALTDGKCGINELVMIEGALSFGSTFNVDVLAICEKSRRIGVICLGDNF